MLNFEIHCPGHGAEIEVLYRGDGNIYGHIKSFKHVFLLMDYK